MTARIAALSLAAALVAAGCNQPLSAPAPATPAAKPEAAKQVKGVPSKLFEIELGKTYHFTDGFTKSDLPVAKLSSLYEFPDGSRRFAFHPRKDYKAFPVGYSASSNYMISTLPVAADRPNDHEVIAITWEVNHDASGVGDKQKWDDYAWGKSMCEMFEADLEIEPITRIDLPYDEDVPNSPRHYICNFQQGELQIIIRGHHGRLLELGYIQSTWLKKHKAAEMSLHKLKANDIRPY